MMKILALVCIVSSAAIALATTDGKLDLRSVLLQILNKVETQAQANTLTGINLANSPDVDPDKENAETLEQGKSNTDALNENNDYQESVLNTAIEEFNDEIARLKNKYTNELQGLDFNTDPDFNDDNESENKDEDVNEFKHKGHGHDYATLIGKMKHAARKLLFIRLKLQSEYGIIEDKVEPYSSESSLSKEETGPLTASEPHKLMQILADIESYQEKEAGVYQENKHNMDQTEDFLKLALLKALQKGDHNDVSGSKHADGRKKPNLNWPNKFTKAGQVNTDVAERDWHVCRPLGERCLGWFPDCCEKGTLKNMEFPLCCSRNNKYSESNPGKPSGICIPNPGEDSKCFI